MSASDASALDLALTERRATRRCEHRFRRTSMAYFRDGEQSHGRPPRGARCGPRARRRTLPARSAAFVTRPTAAGAGPSASSTFLRAHERLPDAADRWRERHLRARAAVLARARRTGRGVRAPRQRASRARGHHVRHSATRLKRRRSRHGGARRACIWSMRSPRDSASSITCTSSVWSRPTGPSARAATSFIRAAC